MARQTAFEGKLPLDKKEDNNIKITFLRSWGIGLLEILGLSALVKLIKDIKDFIGLDTLIKIFGYAIYVFIFLVALPVLLGYMTLKIYNRHIGGKEK
jgi:hypothetical protein